MRKDRKDRDRKHKESTLAEYILDEGHYTYRNALTVLNEIRDIKKLHMHLILLAREVLFFSKL